MAKFKSFLKTNKMFIFWIIAGSILATVIALNFTSGEKKIDKQITELYAVNDPQFLRSMGSLLGPSITSGNHVTTLLNGDEIFPSMLAAIRGAQQSITFETYTTGQAR